MKTSWQRITKDFIEEEIIFDGIAELTNQPIEKLLELKYLIEQSINEKHFNNLQQIRENLNNK